MGRWDRYCRVCGDSDEVTDFQLTKFPYTCSCCNRKLRAQREVIERELDRVVQTQREMIRKEIKEVFDEYVFPALEKIREEIEQIKKI